MRELPFLLLLTLASCGWNAAGVTGCQPLGRTVPLPSSLGESSGIAWSRARSGVLLSHNDGGHDAVVYALDSSGRPVGEVPIRGGGNRDWEDMATASCGGGEGTCIYLSDTGDNAEAREDIVLYRLEDAGAYDGEPVRAEVFPLVLPDGPRDMEALFVLPGEDVYFVSKGRSHAVTVYRYPPPLRRGELVTLEAVQDLSEGPLAIPSQITGADATPDGRLVVIRSYQALRFFRVEGGRLVPVDGGVVNLRTLNEAQGEAVGLGPDGQVALTSEGGNFGRGATMTLLRCSAAAAGSGGG